MQGADGNDKSIHFIAAAGCDASGCCVRHHGPHARFNRFSAVVPSPAALIAIAQKSILAYRGRAVHLVHGGKPVDRNESMQIKGVRV